MYSFVLIFLCSFLFAVNIQAEEGVSELVLCIQNEYHEPMKHVNVTILRNENVIQHVKSDTKGIVTISNLSLGLYQIQVKSPFGYQEKQTQEFEITPYNQETGMKVTIQLYKNQTSAKKSFTTWFLFICISSMVLFLGIYVFRTYHIHNLT